MVLFRSFASLILPVLAFQSLSARALPSPWAPLSTVTLKLAVKPNSSGIEDTTVAAQARGRALLQRDSGSSVSAISAGNMFYGAEVGVGNPPTYCKLLVLSSVL
jgi:saccharopepsin